MAEAWGKLDQPENIWSDELYVEYYLDMMKEQYPESQAEREANFLEGAVNLMYGDKLLDLCSGAGRHTLAMAKRGYRVTGVDLSPGLVQYSQDRAENSPVKDQIEFVQGDVRNLEQVELSGQFKAAYSLASLGFHMNDHQLRDVLRGVRNLLEPHGYLVIDVINREFLLREFNEKDWTKTEAGYNCLRKAKFDFESSCTINQKFLKTPEAEEKLYYQWMRAYTLKEMLTFLQECGFSYQQVYGHFRRGPYSISSPRMIVVATRED